METPELNVVTGAFGYTGQYITRRLLSLGKQVKTLTGHPDRSNSFGDRVAVARFDFDNPRELAKSLQGVTTLYNTYWVRFSHGQATFDRAIENTKTLIRAAEVAGVRRLVHVSITNASEESPLPYFRGKGRLETAIVQSRLSYAVVRPTVIFATEDILINNIAWLLRRFPVFFLPGRGDYSLQPIFVEDMAEIVVDAGQQNGNLFVDAVGPEVFRFDDLVHLIAQTTGSSAKIIHLSPGLALTLSRLIGFVVKDVVLTHDEVEGLMSNLLISSAPPTGKTSIRAWLAQHAGIVGAKYASELARHYR